jgi:transposase
MDSVARIHVARELKQAGQRAEYIAERVGVNRATVYRWLRGIRQRGIVGYIRQYRQAKKGHRHRKTHSYIEQRILRIRREHHECCGEKIVYWLEQEGIHLHRSTVYRILNKHLQLRPKGRKNTSRGPLPQADGPRKVIQMDTTLILEAFSLLPPLIFSAVKAGWSCSRA